MRTRSAGAFAGAVLLVLGSAGCGGTLATVSAARAESPVWGRDARPAAVQATPSAAWRSRPASLDANVSYAPSFRVESGIAPLVRHRLAAEAGSGRAAGLHPFGRLGLDYGKVRPGDLVAEGVTDPLPQTDLLESYGVRGEVGVQGRPDRRTLLTGGVSADRSGGRGASAAALPVATRAQVYVRGERQATRDLRWDGGAQVTRYVMERAALLAGSEARATLRVSDGLSLAASAGGGAARSPEGTNAFRPIGGLAATWAPKGGGGTSTRASLATRPDFDRLDGGLRQRILAQAGAETSLRRDVGLAASLNWLADVGGDGPRRRLLTADATLLLRAPGDLDVSLAARLLLQGGELLPGATDPSEARLQLGLSRRLSIR